MSKYNQKTETDRLYKHFNSHEHRVERVNDILKEIKIDIEKTFITTPEIFFNMLDKKLLDLKQELNAKKYLNSMWYCHD
jgi:hypothetical protein